MGKLVTVLLFALLATGVSRCGSGVSCGVVMADKVQAADGRPCEHAVICARTSPVVNSPWWLSAAASRPCISAIVPQRAARTL